MDLSYLFEYVNLIIVGICVCTGYVIKNIIPSKEVNKFIPLLMAVEGLGLAVINYKFKIDLKIVLTGLFSGLASTGLYECFKNLIKEKDV